jgi:hypothetical protein
MTEPAPHPRRTGPLITAGVIFCLLTALAYAAWRTCTGPADRGRALSAQEVVEPPAHELPPAPRHGS